MTPQKQAFLHDPANGIYGDCFRTVIACLLDLERDTVPHFYHADVGTYAEQRVLINAWLEERKFRHFDLAWDKSLEDLLAWMGHMNPEAYWMLSGLSRTGVNHVVICKGGEIVWDPSLTDAGIIGPCLSDDGDGLYWIGLLIRS